MLIRVTVRNNDHKIQMIRLVRMAANMGLRESRDFVEARMANVGDTFLVRVQNPGKAFNSLNEFDTGNWAGAPAWSDMITVTVVPETPVLLNI